MRLVTMQLKKELTPKGVRRVPINVRSLTGEVNGQEFESSLERDLLLLAHWDTEVDWYQSQPVTLEYTDANGKVWPYTPDLLISYWHQDKNNPKRKPQLCEVKYRSDLFEDCKKLRRKIRAGRKHAREKGWEFKIFTEKEIRTPYLKNIQFLWMYRFSEFHDHHFDNLRMILSGLDHSTPKLLLEKAYQSKELRGEGLWTLWCMVARLWVNCDLSEPLTMHTKIWIDE